MEGKIQTKNTDSLKILHPKILGSCISPNQKYGLKLCFSHKFDGKRLFLRCYRIESRKMPVAETFYLPKLESSYCKS